jgi:Uma2 family endonuclease
VRSPDDGWKKILAKVSEYLNAGVSVVCVLDDDPPTIYVYAAGQRPVTLGAEHELTLPDVLPGFSVPVSRFFE